MQSHRNSPIMGGFASQLPIQSSSEIFHREGRERMTMMAMQESIVVFTILLLMLLLIIILILFAFKPWCFFFSFSSRPCTIKQATGSHCNARCQHNYIKGSGNYQWRRQI
ncbi:uncharacterized protein LOC111279706 isoform X2 [Durio zibethinus]|uniref:Uncharacterized protein LOC111279706 isoform X2 n=1 Tax=Durio zibethinus TaxID=66656 RepID=A0A6P5X3P2_DURZI|nr:uncharacterized protein LOC111279706 isoform X2 [Durio zibethinus]